jgi:beta-lactam-binding protein with PASTA domain
MSGKKVLLCVLGISMLVLVTSYLVGPEAQRPPTTRAVPDVRGLPVSEAAEALEHAGFAVSVVPLSPTIGTPEMVLETRPLSGVRLPKGQLVELLVPRVLPGR